MRVRGKLRQLLFKIVARTLRAFGMLRSENDGFKAFSAALAEVFKNRHCDYSFANGPLFEKYKIAGRFIIDGFFQRIENSD